MIYVINSLEYTIHPPQFWGLYFITTWLNICLIICRLLCWFWHTSPFIIKSLLGISMTTFTALLVLTYLSICNYELLWISIVTFTSSWEGQVEVKKKSSIKLPHYKLALIWMQFSLEYRKCFYSCLGPHVTFFWDPTMKTFIKLYYLFKYFYS